jgi:hypothetical protein
MALTELACKNAPSPADRPRLRLTDSAGLYLEVTPADGRYWRRRDCHACKEKRLALGIYPEVGRVSARCKRIMDFCLMAHHSVGGHTGRCLADLSYGNSTSAIGICSVSQNLSPGRLTAIG